MSSPLRGVRHLLPLIYYGTYHIFDTGFVGTLIGRHTHHKMYLSKNFKIVITCKWPQKGLWTLYCNQGLRHIRTIQEPQGQYIILICKLNQVVFTRVNIYALNIKQRKLLTLFQGSGSNARHPYYWQRIQYTPTPHYGLHRSC